MKRYLKEVTPRKKITADSAEPKSIDELKDLGLRRLVGAAKGKDSINNGIQFIQGFKIYIHPRCVNFITEISNYTWDKDKFGNTINKPIDEFNHLMDAFRYAVEEFISKPKKGTLNSASYMGLKVDIQGDKTELF